MRANSTVLISVLALLWPVAIITEANPDETELVLIVRLHDYAHVPRKTLDKATEETIRVFRYAGVELRFVHCNDALTKHPECNESVRTLHLDLMILSRLQARNSSFRTSTAGFVLSDSAYILFHQLEHTRLPQRYSRATMIGHVIAHELGHLLLGARHSNTGLMSPTFRDKDLERAEMGVLRFDKQQAEVIRNWLRQGIGVADRQVPTR